MKPDQILQELKDLAEKLDLIVLEQSFKNAGVNVKSGFCIIKGKAHCIIDKHVKVQKKIHVLADIINDFKNDHIYVVPAVRDLLDSFLKRKGK